jgi:hypothetical protein
MMLELELAPVIETKFNRLPWCQRASPSTTLYESVKSTDADRLMHYGEKSKGIFLRHNTFLECCSLPEDNLPVRKRGAMIGLIPFVNNDCVTFL